MFWIDCGRLPEVVVHEGYTVCEVNVRDKPFLLPHPLLYLIYVPPSPVEDLTILLTFEKFH